LLSAARDVTSANRNFVAVAATTGSPTMSPGASPTAERRSRATRLDQRERLGAARRVATTTPSSRVTSSGTRPAILLEHQPVAAPAHARQHEGGADIGMAGEGHLGLGREDADLGGVRGSFGGSTKVVSAELNSAAMACICSVAGPRRRARRPADCRRIAGR
jgi:hypothetical protein